MGYMTEISFEIRLTGAHGAYTNRKKKGRSAKCQLKNRRYAGEEYGKARQKEYLKPFMLVNKYATASLFYFSTKEGAPFMTRRGRSSSRFFF
jgi:hypothetical protein